MSQYDLESFLDDLETTLKANLNTKITALNTEKNDGITLAQIDSNAWILQSLDGKQANYDPFIIYGVVDFIEDESGNYSFGSTRVLVNVVIVVADNGEDVNISKRMFRYQRAIRDVVESNFDSLPSKIRLAVRSKIPVDLALINDSFSHKAIGVTIEAMIG